ncbi:DUF1353 domain-containing protein [Yoonia sp. 208BN28-4]|uniref:DUF1353 domain-containing protein n=1 Tax=Yoonia sp. 208BN28-4 TaxID=3126505 RepID=UPI00309BE77D
MKCYSNPRHAPAANPYPDKAGGIGDFSYDTALVLLRLRDAPEMRSGEDADYLTGQPYQVSWTDDAADVHQIVVPAGMITDLTSVPWGFRLLVGRVGPWLEAAIVHDYLYLAWADVPGRGNRQADRAFADLLMRVAMEKARVSLWRRWAIYLALRAFGAGAYGRTSDQRFVDLHDPAVRKQLYAGGPPLSDARPALPLV